MRGSVQGPDDGGKGGLYRGLAAEVLGLVQGPGGGCAGVSPVAWWGVTCSGEGTLPRSWEGLLLSAEHNMIS